MKYYVQDFLVSHFRKLGKQNGLNDEINGSFFDIIVEILSVKKTKYFILENVRNLESHDEFKTWQYIEKSLNNLGHSISKSILSPHDFNIPQHRERLFIVGSLNTLKGFKWPSKKPLTNNISDYLSENITKGIEPEKNNAIKIWQEFVDVLPADKPIPGFPIWSMEFGANYPVDIPISELSDDELENYKGSFGIPLKGMDYSEKLKNLPRYAVNNKERKEYPNWKIRWINDNRKLWKEQKLTLKPVVKKLRDLPVNSWQKFEWNCGNVSRCLRDHIIQFRASGVRIKRGDFFPSLVTVSTQVPIIGWKNRYISPKEGARIQSFDDIILPDSLGTCFGALGNAVNVKLVELVAFNLFKLENNHNIIELQSSFVDETIIA